MGVVQKAKQDAARVANGKSSSVRAGVTVTGSDVQDFLKQFPIQLRLKVLSKGIRKGLIVVRNNAKPRIRESRETGTREKWSKAVKAKRADEIKNLKNSIGYLLRQYDHVVYGVVGPRGNAGSHGWIYEHGASIYLWGKRRYQLKGTPFLRPAADATLTQQREAVVGTLKKEWTKA